jgi:hypothetical protein
MLGLIVLSNETEHPEQEAPAIQIAGISATVEDTVSLLLYDIYQEFFKIFKKIYCLKFNNRSIIKYGICNVK